MATVVGKSRNPILNAAWAAHIKAQRAGTKAAKEEAPLSPPNATLDELKNQLHRAMHEQAKGTKGAASAVRELTAAIKRREAAPAVPAKQASQRGAGTEKAKAKGRAKR